MVTLIRSEDLEEGPHREVDYVDIKEGDFYAGDGEGYAAVAISRGERVMALVSMKGGMQFVEFSVSDFRRTFPWHMLIRESYEEVFPDIRRN
jgi:hypothetical protein